MFTVIGVSLKSMCIMPCLTSAICSYISCLRRLSWYGDGLGPRLPWRLIITWRVVRAHVRAEASPHSLYRARTSRGVVMDQRASTVLYWVSTFAVAAAQSDTTRKPAQVYFLENLLSFHSAACWSHRRNRSFFCTYCCTWNICPHLRYSVHSPQCIKTSTTHCHHS